MFPYTDQDVITCFRQAANVNAATKHFLKKEARAGDASTRFVKEFRDLATGRNEAAVDAFVKRSLPKHAVHFMVLARYAHADVFEVIAESVLEKYAEEFNGTYAQDGSQITIKNSNRFAEIAREVEAIVASGLEAAGVEASGFAKSVAFLLVFDEAVLKEVRKVLNLSDEGYIGTAASPAQGSPA